MVLNLQEMGLVVTGHKSDTPSQRTRWPRPGKASMVCSGLHAGHYWPKLGSAGAELHTTAHSQPQLESCLNPNTKDGETRAKPCEMAHSFPSEEKGSYGPRAN